MNYQELYNKYYTRMIGEGIVKALLCGLTIGFAVGGIIALVAWFVGFSGLWISLGCWLAVTAAVTPIFYFKLFRPDEVKVARRLDGLGLEERVITMQEYKNDSSEIAALQRMDAVATVSEAERKATANGKKLVRYKVPAATIISTCAVGVFGVAMAIVIGLSDFGVIPGGRVVWGEVFPPHVDKFNVNYDVEGSATLTGKGNQTVNSGSSTEEVLYTADRNFYFTSWVDNYGNEYFDGPSRHEENVLDDMELKAFFKELENIKDDEEYSRKLSGGNAPDNSSGGNGSSNGPGNDDVNSQYDQIIDGKKDYNEDYELYYQEIMKYLADNPDLPAEERAMLEAYAKTLK